MVNENNLEKYVSEDGFDLCVMCETKTEYKTDTIIEERSFYVDGAGQLCPKCYPIANDISMEPDFLSKYLNSFL